MILTPDTKPMARDLNLGLDSRIYHISATHLFEIFKYNSDDSEVAQQEIGRLDATGPKLVKPVLFVEEKQIPPKRNWSAIVAISLFSKN